jgi:hypothetical protein
MGHCAALKQIAATDISARKPQIVNRRFSL